MIETGTIYHENCIETLMRMPDGFLDMTLTSPPYDDLREYNGYHFPVEEIAELLLQKTKKGGADGEHDQRDQHHPRALMRVVHRFFAGPRLAVEGHEHDARDVEGGHQGRHGAEDPSITAHR